MTDTTLPTATPTKRLFSPAALLGAGVLVASLGAAAGWMMHANRTAEPDAARLALAPNESVVTPGQPAPAAQQPNNLQAAAQPAPVQSPAPRHAARQPAQRHAEAGTSNHGTAAGSGTGGSTPLATQHAAVCDNCGVVEGVRAFQRKGEGSGMGAVAGGVLGGVLGNQVGKGNGRTAMTVLGAVGGGFAGNEVEKRMKAETLYEVRVRMDDGSLRTLTQKAAPTPGARVVVEGSTLRAVSSSSQGGEPSGGQMVRTSSGT
jgi:outer membrane lipoprotein SlyB